MYGELSERKKEILKAVVEIYIESGGAVGSKMISEREGLNISSATVRNELAELTDMGYLIQPHTSAGRIPSEQAYRFYVDYLMMSYNETNAQIADLDKMMKIKSAQLEKIIDDAGKLAGTLTNLPAIAVISGKRKLSVKKFSLMQNDGYSFIVLMLIAKNTVRSRTINTTVELDEASVTKIQDVLNKTLTGISPSEITFYELMKIEDMLGELSFLASPIIKSVCEALEENPQSTVNIDGVDRLLEYPEFTDTESLRSMLGLLSRKEDIIETVESSDKSGVNVYIGSENSLVGGSGSSSMVFKTITVGGVAVGAIGIIGPCRMDYHKVIATVDQLSDAIAKMFETQAALPESTEGKDGRDESKS